MPKSQTRTGDEPILKCAGCHGHTEHWCARCRRSGYEPAPNILAQACATVALYRLSGLRPGS